MPAQSCQLWADLACWEPGRKRATLGRLSRGLPFGPWGPGTPWGALHVTRDGGWGALGHLDLRHSILAPVPSLAPHAYFEFLSSFLQTSIPFFSSVECRMGPPSHPCHPECLLWSWQLADDL